MRQGCKPGFYIFMGISNDRSWEEAATIMMNEVNEAMETYDLKFVGGLQLKMDDNDRSLYYACQQAVLTPKEPSE